MRRGNWEDTSVFLASCDPIQFSCFVGSTLRLQKDLNPNEGHSVTSSFNGENAANRNPNHLLNGLLCGRLASIAMSSMLWASLLRTYAWFKT